MESKKILTFILIIALTGILLAGCGTVGGNPTNVPDSGKTNAPAASFDANKEIIVVSREEGSGTRGAFIELLGIEVKDANGNKADHTTEEAIVANSTDVVMSQVQGSAYAVGYSSVGSLNDKVKALKVDGVQPTTVNIKDGSYKIARPFNIATKGEVSAVAADFIRFILSKEGQEVIGKSYISIDDNAAPYAGSKPSGKIIIAGSSSVTPIMEKLKEAYLLVNTGAEIEIQQSDSTSGMKAAMDGICDIGMASRGLTDSEKAVLTPTQIAIDGIAVIVNPSNPMTDIASGNIKQIYVGEITKWSEVK